VTAKDGDKAVAQGIRGLTVGEETGRGTRLPTRSGETTTREPTRDKTEQAKTTSNESKIKLIMRPEKNKETKYFNNRI